MFVPALMLIPKGKKVAWACDLEENTTVDGTLHYWSELACLDVLGPAIIKHDESEFNVVFVVFVIIKFF